MVGFITLAMAMICVVFLVCSLRTNIVFFIIFLTLVAAFCLITAAYWFLAMDYTGNAAFAAKLLEVRLGPQVHDDTVDREADNMFPRS